MKSLAIFILIFLLGQTCIPQNPKVEVKLSSDLESAVDLSRGMPLIIHLSIGSTIGITRAELMFDVPDSLLDDPSIRHQLDSIFAPISFAERAKPWYESVVINAETQGQKKHFTLQMHLIEPKPLLLYSMDPDDPLHAFYGIDPDETNSWKPGTVKIRAGIRMGQGSDTVWSETLVLRVGNELLKKPSDYNPEQMYRLASYWLKRDECLKAEPYARILYESDSSLFYHTALLAEVEECKQNYEAALKLLTKAFYQYQQLPFKEPEPPMFLIQKITDLQNRLNNIKE